ncbi:MAG: hypothetical protein GXO79_03150, partial [Chlorobi bacterium]|nr:hypothetical protein [Chlorobiota bacterium]
MKNSKYFLFGILFIAYSTFSQDILKTYQRAEKFMAGNVSKIVYNEDFYPHFIGNTANFWFKNESGKGIEYFLVKPALRSKKLAFNHLLLT